MLDLTNTAFAGEPFQKDLEFLANTIDIKTSDSFRESFFEGVVRGFSGQNPFVSFVVLDSVPNIAEAKKMAAAVKLLNFCASRGKSTDLELNSLAQKSLYFSQTQVFLIAENLDVENGPFVPVIALADPLVASQYANSLRFVAGKKELLVSRQSTVSSEISDKFIDWTSSSISPAIEVQEITNHIDESCTPQN